MNNNLNKMMQNVEKASQIKTPQKKSKLPIYITTVIILAASLSGGYLLIDKNLNSNVKVQKQVKIISDDTITKSTNNENKLVDNIGKFELNSWESKPFDSLTKEDEETILKTNEENFIGWNTASLPSSKDFTSDPEREFDENGIPNINYVSITSEEMNLQVNNIINRISNPIFGKWFNYQSNPSKYINEDVAFYLLNDIATSDFIEQTKNGTAPRLFLVDYDRNEYNGKFTNNFDKIKFIGKPTGGNITYNEDDSVTVEFDVEYKTSSGELFAHKHYILNLVKNNNKLLINGGQINDV